MQVQFIASVAVVTADPNAAAEQIAEKVAEQAFQSLHDARTEPWGRPWPCLLAPEGLIVGLS